MTNPEPTTFEVQIDGQTMPSKHTVPAAYFVMEDDWATFKDAQHKVVYAFPAGRIQMIRRSDPPKEPLPTSDGVRAFAVEISDKLDGYALTPSESAYLRRRITEHSRP